MNKTSYRRSLAVLLAGLLSGCVPSFWGQHATDVGVPGSVAMSEMGGMKVIREGDRTTLVRQDTVLKGRLLVDGGRQTQAQVSDIINNATVAILDPTTNTTIASSVTDGAGNFQVPLPTAWNPSVGANFIIEAQKALGSASAGQRVVRLRSLIQKISISGNFTSITGTNSITISPLTTAVYLRSALGFGSAGQAGSPISVQPATESVYALDGGGTVTNGGALRSAGQFATFSVPDSALNTLSQMVTDSVTGNADPIAQVSNPLVPYLSSLSMSLGPVGGLVLLSGTGFNPVTGGSTVSFNGTAANILYQNNGDIVAGVPSGVPLGSVNVTVQTRMGTSNSLAFTVTSGNGSTSGAPAVSSVSKRSALVGDTITLGGSNFATGSANAVTFANGAGGVTAPVTATYVSATQITVAVPAAAKSGPLMVTTPNGSSNGYWLDVFHAAGTITEDFTTTTNLDAGNTNIQWAGGASPVGSTVSGGNVITVSDWDTINPNSASTDLDNVYDGQNTTYPASIRLSYPQASYPIANNSYLPTDQYTDGSWIYYYAIATNGSKILGMHNNYQFYFPAHGLGDGDNWLRNTNNITWTPFGYALTSAYKLAGLTSSNTWFYMDETQLNVNNITWLQTLNGGASVTNGQADLYWTDNVQRMSINKIAPGNISSSNYGFKIGSDGTYIYLLAGPGIVNGTIVANGTINLYKFRPDSIEMPTRLTLVKYLLNIVPTSNFAFSQYSQLVVDRRGFYFPGYNASGTTDSQCLYSLRDGSTKNINVGFGRRSGNWMVACWDAVNDQYFSGNYGGAGNYNFRSRFVPGTVATTVSTGSVTTPAYNLPAGQQWHSVTVVTDPIPTGATVSLDVLTGAGAAIGGYGSLTNPSGVTLQNAATMNQASLKFKLSLAAPSPYMTTPVVRALIIRTIPINPVAQSQGIHFGAAGASDVVVVDSMTAIQSTYGGQIGYAFATSPNNATYSNFGGSLMSVNQAYLKFQVLPAESSDPNSAFSPPIVRKIVLNYHY